MGTVGDHVAPHSGVGSGVTVQARTSTSGVGIGIWEYASDGDNSGCSVGEADGFFVAILFPIGI